MDSADKDNVEDVEEISNSVAFGLILDLIRVGKLTEKDAEYLRNHYRKMYQEKLEVEIKEDELNKKLQNITNEILGEKISLEKVRNEEADEIQRLRVMEDEKESAQKQLEYSEQRATMARFELSELKKIHDDLVLALDNMNNENESLVGPILKQIKDDAVELKYQLDNTSASIEKEKNTKINISNRLEELQKIKEEKDEIKESIGDKYRRLGLEPSRIDRQTDSILKAILNMEMELKQIQRRIVIQDEEIEKQRGRRDAASELKKALTEKSEVHRQTIGSKNKEISGILTDFSTEKATSHDLVTEKVEYNLKKKETENNLRHLNDQSSFQKKDYDNLKRILKKKRGVTDNVRQMLPSLESVLMDAEATYRNYKQEKEELTKTTAALKDDLDNRMAQFLHQEGLEESKKNELENLVTEVDTLEADVVYWLAEEKRQAKLIAVLSNQRDIKSREGARVESKEKEARTQIRMKSMVITDLTKRCTELSNRLKEFSALYEIVKNERNKFVNLIQSSTQALAEMREKIRILQNEVEILSNESVAKDKALNKEHSAHLQAQNQRDTLRQDLNKLLSEYRSKQNVVEQQIQEIEKLNVVINGLEKQMLTLKGRYERAVQDRNVTGVQLIDRNDELCVLYERANQQQEALKRGELSIRKIEEELRTLRIQMQSIRRRYTVATKRLPEKDQLAAQLKSIEEDLSAARRRTERLSTSLENPSSGERWRALEGDDPDVEQLNARIVVLEDRINAKREQLLEKELVLEEVSALTEKLRAQAVQRRDVAKTAANELNDLQTRIRTTTNGMLSTVSELSMYQATALRLQQEKVQREKVLIDASWRLEHGEPPTEEAVAEWTRMERRRLQAADASMQQEKGMEMVQPTALTKTTAEPRPTAYIPEEMGIPKPYGAHAPFKPQNTGSTMRHYRAPVLQPVEI